MTEAMASRMMLALAGAFTLAACNSLPPTRSGFLGDYAAVQPDPANGDRLIQPVPAGIDLAAYTSVAVEPVEVTAPGLSAAEARDLSRTLEAALRAELVRDRSVVDPRDAGPGTLRVRVAVTRAMRATVMLNVVSTVLLGPVDNGGAAAEAEVLDAATGRRVLAVVHGGVGQFDVVGYYGQLAHARAELRRFASGLAVSLQPQGTTMR